VYRQAAMPQGHAYLQVVVVHGGDEIFCQGDLEYRTDGGTKTAGAREQADAGLLEAAADELPFLDLNQDHELRVAAADADVEFAFAQLLERSPHAVDAQEKILAIESVAQLVQVARAAVHGGFLEVGGVESCAEPFEVAGLASIDGDTEIRGG